MILIAYSESPDQTVQMHRLIWAFLSAYAQRQFLHGAALMICIIRNRSLSLLYSRGLQFRDQENLGKILKKRLLGNKVTFAEINIFWETLKIFLESSRNFFEDQGNTVQNYCKTLIFGGHLILALLAIKGKNSKIKKRPIKIKERKKKITNWQKLYSQIHITSI